MSGAARIAAARAERRAQGTCLECGAEPLPGHALCPRHFTAAQQRSARERRRRQSRGLCLSCGAPAALGRTKCSECLRFNNQTQKLRYRRLREAGLCVVCGQRKAERGRVKCRLCTRQDADRYRRRTRARERKGQLFRILASGVEATMMLGQGGRNA